MGSCTLPVSRASDELSPRKEKARLVFINLRCLASA